ncbi:MAG TPA: hypothetical protein VM577_11575 [Anaerovoracaceae bacterium]|nr:hypothetical protein [Anaerovoracaceae bacterium]
MAYTVDIVFFERLAKEIAELYNICQNSEQYDLSLIEITCVLVDYGDGAGYRIISRALIRNPNEASYDMVTDVQGSPEDALKLMIKTLKEKAEKNKYFQYKEKISKYN